MRIHVVVKQVGDYPWAVDAAFLEYRLAQNFIECRQANDTNPRWQFGIVSGDIELADAVAAEEQ